MALSSVAGDTSSVVLQRSSPEPYSQPGTPHVVDLQHGGPATARRGKEGAPVDTGCHAVRTASEESAIVAVLPVT